MFEGKRERRREKEREGPRAEEEQRLRGIRTRLAGPCWAYNVTGLLKEV